MSKRLQVVLRDEEFDQLQETAKSQGMTLSEWVRQSLRKAQAEGPTHDRSHKLAALRAAARHNFPTGDIEVMLSEIERGYSQR